MAGHENEQLCRQNWQTQFRMCVYTCMHMCKPVALLVKSGGLSWERM